MNESFVHRFIPQRSEDTRTLLMLHGTGGDENSLISLGEALLPGAAILSPRGRVLENGMSRFFRRFAEGVFDLDNLRSEAGALSSFVKESAEEHHFDPARVFAVGFSNGANMGHSLLSLHPESLAGGVFVRAMATFPGTIQSGLEGKQVFISSGKTDPMVPIEDVTALAAQLTAAGAAVTHNWVESGHDLTRGEIVAIQNWLAP
jgi:phospholipase/carboxylesterase